MKLLFRIVLRSVFTYLGSSSTSEFLLPSLFLILLFKPYNSFSFLQKWFFFAIAYSSAGITFSFYFENQLIIYKTKFSLFKILPFTFKKLITVHIWISRFLIVLSFLPIIYMLFAKFLGPINETEAILFSAISLFLWIWLPYLYLFNSTLEVVLVKVDTGMPFKKVVLQTIELLLIIALASTFTIVLSSVFWILIFILFLINIILIRMKNELILCIEKNLSLVYLAE